MLDWQDCKLRLLGMFEFGRTGKEKQYFQDWYRYPSNTPRQPPEAHQTTLQTTPKTPALTITTDKEVKSHTINQPPTHGFPMIVTKIPDPLICLMSKNVTQTRSHKFAEWVANQVLKWKK